MASRKKFKSRRKFLVGSSAAALCPAAIAGARLIPVTSNFPPPRFAVGQQVSPDGDKEELHGCRAIVGVSRDTCRMGHDMKNFYNGCFSSFRSLPINGKGAIQLQYDKINSSLFLLPQTCPISILFG
jgi:hypothetical protein